jgi:hypothetical protein
MEVQPRTPTAARSREDREPLEHTELSTVAITLGRYR